MCSEQMDVRESSSSLFAICILVREIRRCEAYSRKLEWLIAGERDKRTDRVPYKKILFSWN